MSQNQYVKAGVIQLSGPELDIPHNVTLVIPAGYKDTINWNALANNRASAPFVILDPWGTIQPKAYSYSSVGYTIKYNGIPYDIPWQQKYWPLPKH